MSIVTASPGSSRNEGWKSAAIMAMWAVLMLLVGWITTDATTARKEMAADISNSQQRIAVLEESQRNERETLKRIEDGIDELRRQTPSQERHR